MFMQNKFRVLLWGVMIRRKDIIQTIQILKELFGCAESIIWLYMVKLEERVHCARNPIMQKVYVELITEENIQIDGEQKGLDQNI